MRHMKNGQSKRDVVLRVRVTRDEADRLAANAASKLRTLSQHLRIRLGVRP